MKYIVIKVDQGRIVREIPIIFPDDLVHKEVLDAIRRIRGFGDSTRAPCVSAGFVSSLDVGLHPVSDGPVRCYGESESIGVKSRGALDGQLILDMDFTHGVVETDGSITQHPAKRVLIRDASEPQRVVGVCHVEEAKAAADAVPDASYVERVKR